MHDVFHFFLQNALDFVDFFLGRFDDQLIVYLQKQTRLQFLVPQALPDVDHGQFNDVRRSALDRRVAGHPLAAGAHLKVRAGQLRQGAAAAKQRLDVARVLRVGDAVLHIPVHLREGVEVGL